MKTLPKELNGYIKEKPFNLHLNLSLAKDPTGVPDACGQKTVTVPPLGISLLMNTKYFTIQPDLAIYSGPSNEEAKCISLTLYLHPFEN